MVDNYLAFDRSRVLHEHIGKLGREPDGRIYTSKATMFLRPPTLDSSIKQRQDWAEYRTPRSRNSPRFKKLDSQLSDDVEITIINQPYNGPDGIKLRVSSISNVYDLDDSPVKEHSINVRQPSLGNPADSKYIFKSRKLNPALLPKTSSTSNSPSPTISRSPSPCKSTSSTTAYHRKFQGEDLVLVPNGDETPMESTRFPWGSLDSEDFPPYTPDSVFSPNLTGSEDFEVKTKERCFLPSMSVTEVVKLVLPVCPCVYNLSLKLLKYIV